MRSSTKQNSFEIDGVTVTYLYLKSTKKIILAFDITFKSENMGKVWPVFGYLGYFIWSRVANIKIPIRTRRKIENYLTSLIALTT